MNSRATQHWDAFVSHAYEDKENFVRPLVEALGRLGVLLWYDEISLKLGDSLSASIDKGISRSQNGIIVVSPAFLQKNWPQAELHALMTRRVEEKLRLVPIWHNVTRNEVAASSPMLADLVALQTHGRTAQDIAITILAAVRPDLYEARDRSQLEKLAGGEAFEKLQEELLNLRAKVSGLLCPNCDAPLVERIASYDDMDPNLADVDVFECGHVVGGNAPRACPHDPKFPAIDEYDLQCPKLDDEEWWLCRAVPKTRAAARHHIGSEVGGTEKEARNRLLEKYNRSAPRRLKTQLVK